MTLKEKCEEHDRIEFISNLLKFNRELMDLDIKHVEEIESLNNIINKAIEYIENKVISNCEVIDQLRKIEVKELLEILKGVDKNG